MRPPRRSGPRTRAGPIGPTARSASVRRLLPRGSLLGLGPGAGGLTYGATPLGGDVAGVPLRVGGLQLLELPGRRRRQVMAFAEVVRQVEEPRAAAIAGVGELPVARPDGALATESPGEGAVGVAGHLTADERQQVHAVECRSGTGGDAGRRQH